MKHGHQPHSVLSPRRFAAIIPALVAGSLLAACAGGGAMDLAKSDAATLQQTADKAEPRTELQKATEYWGKAYAKDPRDPQAALSFARNLKAMGEKRQALSVLQEAHLHNANHKALNSEYGRLALEHDQITLAEKLLEQADDVVAPDWRTVSARGTAMAKQGKYHEAIPLFERALKLAPEQPSILNNLALAHAMDGHADKAEQLLKRAAAGKDADPRVTQNLTLVLGLQGKHDEAKVVAAADTRSENTEENVAFVRAMVKADPKPMAAPMQVATGRPAMASTMPTASVAAQPQAAAKAKTAKAKPAKGAAVETASTDAVDAAELVRRLADGAAAKAPAR